MKELIIFGAGGFSKSVLDSLNMNDFKIVGFIDKYKEGYHKGYPIICDKLDKIKNKGKYFYFIAIGDPSVRRDFYLEAKKYNLNIINIIDSTAIVSNNVILGDGIYIGKMCIVNSDTEISSGVVINTRSLVEHGNFIGFCSNISTNVVLNGDVRVGECSFIGSCSVVNGQITIGDNSTIGSGSVVIRNVPNKVVVAGSPTRLIRDIK